MRSSAQSGPTWIQIATLLLLPLFTALLGSYYTWSKNRAEIEVARINCKTDLVDRISLHLGDKDPAIAVALIGMLNKVDSEAAGLIKLAVSEPVPGEGAEAETEQVSDAVRRAVRAEAAVSLPEVPGEKWGWYAVMASCTTEAEAVEAARQALRTPGLEEAKIVIYVAQNGYFALTLGGAAAGQTAAEEGVRKVKEADPKLFATAYVRHGKGWREVTRVAG